ncbi:hypothetical protein MLP_07740 [Microlunatus phosphovorus NM-1]|uniref:Uncharacterized protein n=1 Tax=Microlunatus phosphovorus (strain ATCC 700054 / DSM 10555 / JCM 9379 / NBRC 101784 / NCIMB 13414 / VKM Ac-1990 / NM-1) TaxID=1032480 RepID=F5XLQ9_MICPN|nr:hypothetical protein MLP_07740 [Microlunatus phosphovorus NM-1]
MKAVVYDEPRSFRVREIPTPDQVRAGSGESATPPARRSATQAGRIQRWMS